MSREDTSPVGQDVTGREAPPSRGRRLWTLSKLLLGVLLVGFGCWRLWVWAFGPDEALFFAYKVKATSAAEQARFMMDYDRRLRELNRNPEEAAGRADELRQELERELEAQVKRDGERYRGERRMELFLVAFCLALGPGLVWSGNGALWRTRAASAVPGPAPGRGGG